jgi:glucose/mannose transport system substrate-binding protein
MKRHLLSSIVACGLGVIPAVLGGCGSSDGQSQNSGGSGVVEIFSWWTAEGEKPALDAMLKVYTDKHPNTEVINAAQTGSENAQDLLERRLTEGNPPDTFQALVGTDLMRWVTRGTTGDATSIMEPIDFIAESEGWSGKFGDAVLQAMTLNGHLYGVPVDMERNNALFYNKQIFADNGLQPPTTLDELFTVCAALKAKGITPIALGSIESWTLGEIMWHGLLIAEGGPEYYMSFFQGNEHPDDPQVKNALTKLGQMLDYTNADASTLQWDEAVNLMYEGKAAMTIMGDWTKGYLTGKGWEAGNQFDEVPTPGTGDVLVFDADVFGLPKGAPDRDAVIELLKTFGSTEGQTAFNKIKGAVPARIDAPTEGFDSISQRTIDDIGKKRLVPILDVFVPTDFLNAIQDSLLDFAKDRNVDNEVRQISNRYASLKP